MLPPGLMILSSGEIRQASTGDVAYVRVDRGGYATVRKSGRDYRVNRLVCEAFHGAPPIGSHAAHDDGVRRNNQAGNLEWKTPAENEADKLRHGTYQRGEQAGFVKLTETQVKSIRRLVAKGFTQREVARRFNVSNENVSLIIRRRTWRHV